MNATVTLARPMSLTLDNLAADLASAAYRVALERVAPGSWIDLELEIWRSVRETLRRQTFPRRI
jgi:hypothetical protein